jgi:hypothetical protein
LLEVRCEKQVIFISPSLHKDGNKYTPLDTTKIETIDDKGLLKLRSQISALSEKWVSDADKDKYDAMLDDPNTILGEGSGRHTATLFKVRSFYWKYSGEWLNLSDSERFDSAWQWHQAHCNPPRSRDEFDLICKWIKDRDRAERDKKHDEIREQRRHQKEQGQQERFIGCDAITQDVHQELEKHDWSIMSHDGPKFAVAHTGLNQTVEAEQCSRPVIHTDGTKHTMYYLQLQEVHINAIPIDITRYEDPINTATTSEQLYKIVFKTSSGKTVRTPESMSIDDTIGFLNSKSLICSPQGAKAVLAHVIHTFDCKDKIKVSR